MTKDVITKTKEETELNTFLPYPNFSESVAVLDTQQLNIQRREAMHILNTLEAKKRGAEKLAWYHNPAVLMWEGHEEALKMYLNAAMAEWIRRGSSCNHEYVNYKLKSGSIRVLKGVDPVLVLECVSVDINDALLPFWFGNPDFHLRHKSNLKKKNFDYYSKLWPEVQDDLEYWWPVCWNKDLNKAVSSTAYRDKRSR